MTLQSPQKNASSESGAWNSPIRVAIVDDSAVIRGLTKRWLREDPEIDVVASFSDGAQAVANIVHHDCDVLILDIEMPQMDGLTALPKLIASCPGLQIIMASTLSHRNADISMRALSLGAADYLAKPASTHGLVGTEDYRRELIEKVKALGAARPDRPKRARVSKDAEAGILAKPARKPVVLRKAVRTVPHAVIIGSSTGGPQALTALLGALKKKLAVPILITQHMPPMFTSILAEQIAKVSGHPCAEGCDGEIVLPGHIYLAPGDYHMTLRREGDTLRIALDQNPPVNYCRPAVDPLFRSAAEIYGASALGIVLTGMGHDGREGARAIVDAGGQIIAQDEATSVVWGMPGAVAEAGLASNLLALSGIAPEVLRILGGGRL